MLRSLALLLISGSAAAAETLPLFQPWSASDWQAQDDSVRPGGLSTSSLEVLAPGTADNPFDESIVRFYGNLNSEPLGGSGFASQRTVNSWPGLDLSAYTGLIVEVPYTDGKTYSLNLKDVEPLVIDGREQASVSWEYNFQLPASEASEAEVVQSYVSFVDLVPTYQGSVVDDGVAINLTNIRRVNIMLRSFFGLDEQEGDFELRIKSVLATN